MLLSVDQEVVQTPDTGCVVIADQLNERIDAVVQFDHVRMAPNGAKHLDQLVRVIELTHDAKVDLDLAVGKAVAHALRVLAVTAEKIPGLQLADGFNVFETSESTIQ